MITKQLFTEIQEYFGLFDDDYEAPSRNEIAKFTDSWINTAQNELSGKTPKEVVKEERMDVGNVEKFAPEISMGKSEGFSPVMAKNRIALGHMKNQDPESALPIFEELVAGGEEHEALFFNIGSCYKAMYVKADCQDVKLLNAAFKWLEKALKLNPDHELSKKYLIECDQLLLMRRMKRGFMEREKIMIPVGKIREMSLEALEKELTSRIEDFNKEEFLELAMAAKDAFGVSDTYFDEERVITHGIDEDNIYPLLIEYWQRFYGDKTDFPFLEKFVNDHFMFEENADLQKETTFENVHRDLTFLHNKLAELPKERKKQLVGWLLEDRSYDYVSCLCYNLPMIIGNARIWGEKRYKLFDLLYEIFDRKEILYDKVDAIDQDGNREEAVEKLNRMINSGDRKAKMRLAYVYSSSEDKNDHLQAKTIADEFMKNAENYGFLRSEVLNFATDIYSNIGKNISRKELEKRFK